MSGFQRPNVLLIYTDQQRWDTLSCYCDSPILTRNIDSIARDGARFDSCFTQSPICGPSRMSFLTGRYCSSVGVGTNGEAFPENDCMPVHRILRDYGYETAQLGKLHFLPHAKRGAREVYPNYGFDRFIVSDEPGCYDDPYTKWVECNSPEQLPRVRTSLPPAAYRYGKPEYSTVPRNTHEPYLFEGDAAFTHSAFVTHETCQFLKERQKNRPFFAISGFYAPHPPVNPPKECVDRVDVSKIKLPPPVEREQMMPELRGLSEEEMRRMIQYYLALTLHADDCVGEILKTLRDEGLEENTLVIFTSDHGEYLGEHGRIQKGMPGYDCCTHVPLLMRYPQKIRTGLVCRPLVEALDVVPTILDYCGIQTPPDVQGLSLKKLLDGTVSEHKDCILTEHFVPHGLREAAVRTEKFRYYCSSAGEELLFDLTKDPYELSNVAADPAYAQVLSEMRLHMILKLQQAAAPGQEPTAEY